MDLLVNNMADPDFPTMNLTLTTYYLCLSSFHSLTIDALKFSNTVSYLHSNAILNIKMFTCISLGLKITKIKIPQNIVERLWHINNVMSYEDFQFKM